MTTGFEHLRGIGAADVYKAGTLAGRLIRRDGTTVFSYVADYSGPSVATTLPLVDGGEFVATGGAVPPFFAGLLPEGRRLSNVRRAVKTSADDELSLLLAVGADTIGDVQVVPSGVAVVAPRPLVEVEHSWSEVSFADVLAGAGVFDPVALPGVQDKASARMISVPLARRGGQFLLKVDPPEFPHVVVNEAYFVRLARALRVPVVTTEVVHDRDGRAGLLVERFDRLRQADGSSRSLACEDGCQVLGRWPADKYTASAEEVVGALADRCAARAVAIRRLFEQLCFAWLTGNGDAHAKNLSIVASPDTGEWTVAPAYDLPSTLPYGDRTFALTVGGRTDGLSRRRLLAFATEVGLPLPAATTALDRLVGRLADLPERVVADLPFAPGELRTMAAVLERRLRDAR